MTNILRALKIALNDIVTLLIQRLLLLCGGIVATILIVTLGFTIVEFGVLGVEYPLLKVVVKWVYYGTMVLTLLVIAALFVYFNHKDDD